MVSIGALGIIIGFALILHGVGAIQVNQPDIFALVCSLLLGLLFLLFGLYRIVRALRTHPKRWLETPANQGG